MKTLRYFILLFICCSISCQNNRDSFSFDKDGNDIRITLEKQSDSLFHLNLFVNDCLNSTWPLAYPVYQFDYGDVADNACPEIAVGVIKPTRYDTKPDKRLFIFRITDDYYIRPLWLGSRVSQPLEDFHIVKGKNQSLIRTIEKEPDGTYLVAEYKWRGFGLEHICYIERNIDIQRASNLLCDESVQN